MSSRSVQMMTFPWGRAHPSQLRRAVNRFELAGSLLCCSQGLLPWRAQDLQQPWGSNVWGGLGEDPTPKIGDGKEDGRPPP